MNDLNKIWIHVAEKYSHDPLQIDTFWREIEICYSESGRAYHNLDHIQYLIDQAIEFRGELDDFDAIVMAIFYHDIIYDTGRKDNEESSASLAKFRLAEIGFPSHILERCVGHILATKEHVAIADRDANFMIDFDLAILGEEPDVYELYREKVRREYWNISDADFNIARGKWINSLLKRERIFVTDEYYGRYEESARGNLQKELLMTT